MDTTVTSNSEPVEQCSNNQPNSSPADNMYLEGYARSKDVE